MEQKIVHVGDIPVANDKPFTLFAGMNVLESRDLAMQICEHYVKVTDKLGIPYVFKASVITSYSIHYTKLYECQFCRPEALSKFANVFVSLSLNASALVGIV